MDENSPTCRRPSIELRLRMRGLPVIAADGVAPERAGQPAERLRIEQRVAVDADEQLMPGEERAGIERRLPCPDSSPDERPAASAAGRRGDRASAAVSSRLPSLMATTSKSG